MSPPPSNIASRRSPSSEATESGTSWIFSARRVAVTMISSSSLAAQAGSGRAIAIAAASVALRISENSPLCGRVPDHPDAQNAGECSRAGTCRVPGTLLEFRFLVGHVLARDRVELAELHLFGMQALVLGGRVEMAGAGGGNELDLVAHGLSLRRACRRRAVP